MKYIMLGSKLFFGLLFAILMPLVSANAQSSLIEIQQGGTGSLTGQELAQYNQIQQNAWVQAQWLVRINPIQNFISGNTLQVRMPESGQLVYFTADNVYAPDASAYTWSGYSADGSSFRIGQYLSGYMGEFYVAATGVKYGLLNISPSRTVLVKYTAPDAPNSGDECGLGDAEDETPEGPDDAAAGCEGNLIRVLFLYTANAATTGLNPQTVAQNIIAEINASTIASGLPASSISFKLANAIQLNNGFVETISMGNDLDNWRTNATVKALRNANYADIVVFLVKDIDPNIAGKAAGIAVSSENAYCIAGISAAALGFTATHEIGHLIGTRHQRCHYCSNSGCDANPLPPHGFPIGTGYRTIMYQNGCPEHRIRVGRWSNPDVNYGGNETGNAFNNNAKKLKNRAPAVSCFRGTPPGTDGQTGFTGGGNSGSGFRDKSILESIRLYPNPVNDVMILQGLPANAIISVMATDGREVLSISTEALEEQAINCSGLTPGVYFLRVQHGAEVEQLKFVKAN